MIPTVSFSYSDEWSVVVTTLEYALRLHHHTPGTLADLEHTCTSAPKP
ncbi:hypothetical protein OG874_18015 [Nocardia sp. NBC_00565]|nr:hypothetical protein [Nocardia sp. NBC_00565]WUC06882.1 hypothetical protein OG874_18015 [Nocardia sp. NBC_00565]